ncbi:DUF6054 family protein [Sinanaerobacter sp. ZZT-01]|uniref:DUF6054 family protein n=1 Tax=Sinanaerobacter sp. ZZT-01 TaxID=3111540 RepID=UPI002D77C45E|nr:DUF6054 family protein [Sinanaerobacter sp. ZZT-01]WRR93408.1 DUF6054 family protein [Sinanaerobacter sp. ZZT-01]
MGEAIKVSLNIQDTVERIEHAIVDGSITGVCIDSYELTAPNGGDCAVRIYEKHYYRAGNRLTLTVVADNFEGTTRIHCTSGGGGEGLFRFDWGASESFSSIVFQTLEPYRIE